MTADLRNYSVRTDLALESREMASPDRAASIPGVQEHVEEDRGIKITRIHVQTEEGSRAIGRIPGRYITIEVPGLRRKDSDLQDRVATSFAQLFASFLGEIGIGSSAKVLIVGLGNWNVTPDALGPLVVENVLVTRHYFEVMPDQVSPGYREVSAVAPGVLGVTGIESSDIVQGIVDRIRPDLIIAIDALASKALERVNTTIQIADIGIHPGSGIGNKRRGLTREILGVPCIAIGVPTVCYASTIVNNAFEMMREHFKQETNQTRQILGILEEIGEQDRLLLVKEVLEPLGHDLIVTPKEVDEFMEDMANIIASGLNAALHEAVDSSNVSAYTH
ncbi:GPR endopeptidase [Paenibacillus melissococcoides]|uniref:Germination protease n=1 Tax=Paenibacillus melissococcoides TaxID=2912268 RepID=A0ABM9G7R0_9BACL|nr:MULTISPECIES: GPR endopeptidase [Paenibacillus]MEB9895258.1 GPR endopeptidase [Bacillus cereus]CAH8247409.1 GPR endopeptidase [Paenibacillus melissococcoides]CAH8705231.1 GPR endopeptidase [Paenibacillus melissococcoides]CAH8708453.1 GPR endopeptidase [Paenibacillus melissococcoides]GIO79408.1 germination protease [Paenibacillus dendritiformis]